MTKRSRDEPPGRVSSVAEALVRRVADSEAKGIVVRGHLAGRSLLGDTLWWTEENHSFVSDLSDQ